MRSVVEGGKTQLVTKSLGCVCVTVLFSAQVADFSYRGEGKEPPSPTVFLPIEKGQAISREAKCAFLPFMLCHPQLDVSLETVPAPGTLAYSGELEATPRLALVPSALGQVAWDESDR